MQTISTDRPSTAKARPFTTKKEFYAQFRKKSIAQELWLRFLKNKTAVMGLIIFCIIVAVAITAPWIANYETVVIKINIGERLQSPSMKHWFGTDELGRDILARIVHGAGRHHPGPGAQAHPRAQGELPDGHAHDHA